MDNLYKKLKKMAIDYGSLADKEFPVYKYISKDYKFILCYLRKTKVIKISLINEETYKYSVVCIMYNNNEKKLFNDYDKWEKYIIEEKK